MEQKGNWPVVNQPGVINHGYTQAPGYTQGPPQPGGINSGFPQGPPPPGGINPGYPPGVPQPPQMMPNPGPIPGCPEGLEYLAAVDQLMCYQEVHLMEVVTNWECANQYRIMNNMQQQVYFIQEESDAFQRQCCGPSRGFQLHVLDNYQQEVMTISRTFKCCAGCSCCADGCCMYPIEIFDKHKQKLGMIRVMDSFCAPHCGIFDSNDDLLYEIWGPTCPCQGACCTADIDFPIRSVKDGSQVGNLSKVWAGVMREMYTNADTYGLRFPMDLDIKHKALMIGVVFLIDFTYFERQKRKNNNQH